MVTFEDGLKINLADQLATEALASALAKELVAGLIIYLHGELGVGKTTLVRAMLRSLGYVGSVKSPTYTLVEQYTFRGLDVYHFDLYRLVDAAELEFIGIRDYDLPTVVSIFEWANKGAGFIPAADIEINLDFLPEGRRAALMANTPKGLDVLQKMTIGV